MESRNRPMGTACVITILAGLGPMIAGAMIVAGDWILSAVILATSNPVQAGGMLGASALLALGAAAMAAVLCHAEAQHPSFLGRLVLLFILWNIGSAVLLQVAMMAIGGMSMAAVEGVITPAEVARQSAVEALRLLLPAQLWIAPWVLLATSFLHQRQAASAAPPH